MSTNAQHNSVRLFAEALAVLDNGGDESALLDVLKTAPALKKLIERAEVAAVTGLQQLDTFTARGHRQRENAICDLTGDEHWVARHLLTGADTTSERLGEHGETLPPVLPATAKAFTGGAISLRHVVVVAKLMSSPRAERLTPELRDRVEAEIARLARDTTPRKLHTLGAQVIANADHDGPGDQPEPQVNELHITTLPGGGGTVTATFTDPVRFQTVLAVIEAKAAPLTADDPRTPAQRRADALTEVCGYVADHARNGIIPTGMARRPQVSLLATLTDLQNRFNAACLTFGGTPSPSELRRICCDAGVIPIVMGGDSQPLDVGQTTRTISPAMRRAVEARDRGCAHPGCDRPPSWSEVHHIWHWADGGPTALRNLVMVCKIHHRELHSTEWIVRMASDGLPEFIPPTWVDETRTPRRNPRPDLNLAG